MLEELTSSDFDMIAESLQYYKRRIEDYREYPAPEFQKKQLERLNLLIMNINAARENRKP